MDNDFLDMSFVAEGIEFLDSDEIENKYLQTETDKQKLEKIVDSQQEKINLLERAVKDLIMKLKSNPDKTTIKWPDRIADMNKFEQKINNIIKGQ